MSIADRASRRLWRFEAAHHSFPRMPRSSDPQQVAYLPTGWRVVGRGADRIAERVAASAVDRLDAGAVENTLYAVRCSMDPVVRGRPTVERVLEAITEQVRQAWSECPRLVRDEEVSRPPSRFGGMRYEVFSEPGREWLAELVWRSVHPVVAGAPITTHVMLEERPSFTRLSIRVTADEGRGSVRGYVGAGQAQPAFLRALRHDLTPSWMGGPLRTHTIGRGQVEDFVHSVLAAPARQVPAAVLSPLESGEFVVDPEDLAWDLLGRARLYVIRDHRLTFELSDAVGDRRMSCYWGAARCYLPGWTRHDDPLEHPLLIGDRLADPIMRATWLGEVGMWLASEPESAPSVEERRARTRRDGPRAPDRSVDEPVAGPAERQPAGKTEAAEILSGAGDSGPAARATPAAEPQIPDPAPLIRTVIDEVRGLGALVGQLTDELERLRTVSAVRSSSTNAIERRLARLEDLLEQAFPAHAQDRSAGAEDSADRAAPGEPRADDEAATVVEVVRHAAESHADALLVLDSAYAAATDAPYEDPERVRAILDAMARVARRRRDGVLGTSLREAFADLGIDYRAAIARNTPARLREQYRFPYGNGEVVEAEEHIVLGNTYDPRRCLRVYFSSRVPNEPRFVIGHVGRHFEVQSTT